MMKNYQETILNAMGWIHSQMLTFDQGYYGIYERIRIDEHIRTNWSRPDCNAEYLRVLYTYREMTGDGRFLPLENKIFQWLERTQDADELSVWKGSFPFYVIEGYIREPKVGETIYQNDNGKIMISLCRLYQRHKEEKFLRMAEDTAAYWMKTQQPDGTFGVRDGKNVVECRKGPCFVQWMVSGLYLLYAATGKEEYRQSAEKGLQYLFVQILPCGRSATSYETIHMEEWRPVSSETGNMLYTLCVAYEATKEESLLEKIEKTGDYLLSLQDACGGIRNCDENCLSASLQDNQDLCDLVYTAGFSLQAFVLAYQATQKEKYKSAAVRLADFLAEIQCKGESPLWDGGWRGSYNMRTKIWDGRANQNNPIDEGGMYSVYTGWCCTNIMTGLQELMKILEEEG